MSPGEPTGPEDALLGTDLTGRDRAIIVALTKGAAESAESRVLDRLVGSWSMSGTWDAMADGSTVTNSGRFVNSWVMAGRVVESRGFDANGVEISKVLYAWDPNAAHYVAFSVTVLSNSFDLEVGRYDEAARTLTLRGNERVARGGRVIGYARTIRFDPDGTFEMAITYPDEPDPWAGSMVTRWVRTCDSDDTDGGAAR